MARGAKLPWCLFSTDRSGAEAKYPTVLLRYKIDAPSARCGVFDSEDLSTFFIHARHNLASKETMRGKGMLKETAKEFAYYVRRVYFMPIICISCHIYLQFLMICYFIPGNNITRPSLAAVIPESEDFYGEKQRRNEGR